MLWRFALDYFHTLFARLPTPFDLHLDTSEYLRLLLVYTAQMNHFFPVFDAYLPIAAIWLTIHSFFGITKIIEVVLNVVRGAGIRLLS